MRIALLGSRGYIGSEFCRQIKEKGWVILHYSHDDLSVVPIRNYLRVNQPDFVINCAGYVASPNVDACENQKSFAILGNVVIPVILKEACEATDTPMLHVSSGCIFNGGGPVGFSEKDEPNFSFDHPPCSFYSGTKALAEKAIASMVKLYSCRLRIPFDQFDNRRNFLTKIQTYRYVYDNVNSLSHRSDFVNACLHLVESRAPFGTYNVTNPGFVSTREVVEMIQEILKPDRQFQFWESDEQFYLLGAKTPRSNCILDVSKLMATGAKMRPVRDALRDSLEKWKVDRVE